MTTSVFVLLIGLTAVPQAVPAHPCPVVDTTQEDAALATYNGRIADYVALHKRLERPLPPQQISSDMRVVRQAMDALAKEIKAARRGAGRGDIFTPEVAAVFRVRIANCLPADEMEMIITEREEEDPVRLPAIHVNDRWPKGMPFIFVPPQLLSALPRIPAELQYRIVGHALVLWDHHADLIVDILPDAFPKVK
jgi:hypothetical protein